MAMDRRSFVKGAAASYAALSAWLTATAAQINMPARNEDAPKPRKVPYKRIATEEAWGPEEMFEMYRKLIDENPYAHSGLASMWGNRAVAVAVAAVAAAAHKAAAAAICSLRGWWTWVKGGSRTWTPAAST